MTDKDYDIVLLTQKDYVNPASLNPYIENILKEDALLKQALEKKGLKVTRTHWDNEHFAWENVRFALFRATWDYFHRFNEFHNWLQLRKQQIQFINPYPIIEWNIDKKYLSVLQEKKINIPPTLFLKQGRLNSLSTLFKESGWNKAILKPAIAGGARHTYLCDKHTVNDYQNVYQSLINKESMLLQEFQENIKTKGEVSFIVFGGKYSHAVLKKVKSGDFRVQDDFGGTVHPYVASSEETSFVENVVSQCEYFPVYARVDVMWDNNNQLCLSELELIEPELWLRTNDNAAVAMAKAVSDFCINK